MSKKEINYKIRNDIPLSEKEKREDFLRWVNLKKARSKLESYKQLVFMLESN